LHIDPQLLAVATAEELAAYELALQSESALASPADFGLALAAENIHLGTPFQAPPHVRLISDTVVALIEGRLLKPNGRPYRKLMVALPPRHGKSELISRYAPAWYLAKYPERKVMVVGYSDEFAAGFGRDARTLVEAAPKHLSTPLRQDVKAAHRWITEANGAMFTAGIGGPLTGRGGHYIVIDDPIKSAAEAQSETIRQAHWDWVQSTVLTRREPGAVVILVATRWHESDLSGKFLEWEGDDWYQLVLPAIAGEDDPLGRQPGEALWPDRIPLEELEEIRDGGDESMYWWSAMYQQSPTVEGGGIFQADHFRYWSPRGDDIVLQLPGAVEKTVPRASLRTFGVVDLAATLKTTADYSVFALFGVTPDRQLLLLDRVRTRIEGPDHMPTLERLHEAWKPAFWGIERATFGLTLLQTAVRTGRIPVRELRPDGDKVSRAYSASALAMGGRYYLPKQAPWLDEWVHEHLGFPNGAHDDCVDTSAYAAKIVSDRLTPSRRARKAEPVTIEERIEAQVEQNRKKRKIRARRGMF
jgi:predicted phage terminase large subunit-like protein